MPALPSKTIGAKAEDGTSYERKVAVALLEDGTFSVEVPEELEPILNQICKAHDGAKHRAHIGYARSGAKPRVYAAALNDAMSLLHTAAQSYLSAETIRERVICYTAAIDVSFWQNENGDVQPNGCGQLNGGWWAGKLHGHNYDACHRLDKMGFGIAAKVFDKITTKRKTGNMVRFEEVQPPLHEKHTDPCFLLNSWTILDVEPKSCRQMPYTPEAAMFFHNMQVAICKMARSLDEFMSNDTKLKLAIESGKQLLLT